MYPQFLLKKKTISKELIFLKIQDINGEGNLLMELIVQL